MKIFCFFISLLSATFLFGQDSKLQLVDDIFAEWNEVNTPGCALGIIQNGELIYAKGYGFANLEYDMPNTENSVFRIGSTSKQFTAACIILLSEQGKLSLDNTLDQYFPEFPDYANNITIRHLLNHTSGVRDYLTISYLKGYSDDEFYEDSDIMQWLINQMELNFTPGEKFLYSNSGYWLLGQIVKEVAGMNMAEFAENEIFTPLGMNNTHFHNDHSEIVKNRASGYIPTGPNSYQISMTMLDMIGDGGIFTTIADIEKWDDAYYSSKVLNKEFWAKMTEQGVLNNGEKIDYACGLSISDYRGLNTISHGGAFVGFRAELLRFPEQEFTVAIFANRGDANPTRMAYQVADIYLQENFIDVVVDESDDNDVVDQKFVQLKTKDLEKFTGNYWNEENLLARKIYLKNDTLRYFRSETNESQLVPIGKNEFKMINVRSNIVVSFNKDKLGNNMMSFIVNNDEPMVSVEYEIKEYTKEELSAFDGTYYSKELDMKYMLKMEDNLLILYVNGEKVSPLVPIMENLFSNNALGTFQFNSDEKGNIINYRLAVGRVKNLKFEKE